MPHKPMVPAGAPAERNGGIASLPQLLVGGHQPANFRDRHEARAI